MSVEATETKDWAYQVMTPDRYSPYSVKTSYHPWYFGFKAAEHQVRYEETPIRETFLRGQADDLAELMNLAWADGWNSHLAHTKSLEDRSATLDDLIAWVDSEVTSYGKGEMMSMAEAVHGEIAFKAIRKKINELLKKRRP